MVHYKLSYFNARGYAEATRIMFHMAGVEFEDERYELEDWLKPELSGKDKMPFGQMPVLEVDGVQIPQSFAIARFIGRRFGFAGKTDVEQAWVDAFGDLYKDFLAEMKPWAMIAFGYPGGTGDREELKKTALLPAQAKYFGILKKYLKKSKSGFIVDSGITWADLFFYETTLTMKNIEEGYLSDEYPEIIAYFHAIENHPLVKPYFVTRVVTPK